MVGDPSIGSNTIADLLNPHLVSQGRFPMPTIDKTPYKRPVCSYQGGAATAGGEHAMIDEEPTGIAPDKSPK